MQVRASGGHELTPWTFESLVAPTHAGNCTKRCKPSRPSFIWATNSTPTNTKSPQGSSTPSNHPGAAGFPFHRRASSEVVSCHTWVLLYLHPPLTSLPSPCCFHREFLGLELRPTGTLDRVSGCLLLPPWAGMLHPPSLMNYPGRVSTRAPGAAGSSSRRFCLSPKHPRLALGMNRWALTFLMGNLGKCGHKIHPIAPGQAPQPLPTAPGLAPTRGHCKTQFKSQFPWTFLLFFICTRRFSPLRNCFPAGHPLPALPASAQLPKATTTEISQFPAG